MNIRALTIRITRFPASALAMVTALCAMAAFESQAAIHFSVGFNHGSHGYGGRHGGYFHQGHPHFYRPRYSSAPVYHSVRPSYSVSAGSYCYPSYSYTRAYTVPYTTRPYVVRTSPVYVTRSSVVQQNVPVNQAVYGSRVTAVAQPTPTPTPAPTESAWSMLSSGRYQTAAERFAAEAAANPRKGAPKVGHSLATALNHDYDSAIASMRRAFLHDPEGASQAPENSDLAGKIHELALHYHKMAGKYPKDADAMFMLAATAHLIHDHNAASPAIENVIAAGDSTTAALNLQKQIKAQAPTRSTANPSAAASK